MSSLFLLFSVTLALEDGASLIDRVKENYARIKTVSVLCRADKPSELKGKASVFRVQRVFGVGLRVDYLEPARMVFIRARDSLYVYNETEERYGLLALSSLTPLERQIAQRLDYLDLDLFSSMEGDYTFSVMDTLSTGVVFSAKPKRGWTNLSMILVKVDTTTHIIVAHELFDRNKTLISQTVYAKAKLLPSCKAFYPTVIESKTVAEGGVAVERIELSRIKVNEDLPDSVFAFTPPAKAKQAKPKSLLELLGQ